MNLSDRLNAIREANRWREPRTFDAFGPHGIREGASLIGFASNDYLGLTTHPEVIAAAQTATARWGTGATAARLIVGSRPIHDELEAALAEHHGMPAAALFATGYQANLGLLSTIADENTVIYSDELNHASIVDGIRMSRATKFVYPHCDLTRLSDELQRGRVLRPDAQRIIVSDVVFSMDGDLADVAALVRLAERQDATLILDVAHLVFDMETFHRTIAEATCPALIVGTLSKTLASQGGYVAGSQDAIALLQNAARSYIFTTALAPRAAAAAKAALTILDSPEGTKFIARLRQNVDLLAAHAPSPIVPVPCGSEARSLELASKLANLGFLVPAIRPPTVPAESSRLRVALSALHTTEEVIRLHAALDAEVPGWQHA